MVLGYRTFRRKCYQYIYRQIARESAGPYGMEVVVLNYLKEKGLLYWGSRELIRRSWGIYGERIKQKRKEKWEWEWEWRPSHSKSPALGIGGPDCRLGP